MSQDLYVQLVDPAEQRLHNLFSFRFDRPIAVEGLYKLVCRFLRIFFTPVGSHPVRRTEGTAFPSIIGQNYSTLDEIEALVLEAVDDVVSQMKAQDLKATTRPTNERILSAAVTQFVQLAPDGVEFWVTLTSLSGETLSVLIPYVRSA